MSADFAAIVRLFQSGQLPEAGARCQALLAQNPKHFDAHHLLGVILMQAQRPDQAVAHLQQAAQLRASNGDVQLVLGAALAMTGRVDQALPCFQRAVKTLPGNPQALYNLALAQNQLGGHEEARRNFAKLLAKESGNVAFLMGHGAALAGLARFDEAAQEFAKAAARSPGQPDIVENLAQALIEAGRPDSALQSLAQMGDALLSKRPRALFLQGRANKAMGACEIALERLDRALALEPGLAPALITKAALLSDSDRLEEADALLRPLMAQCAQMPEAQYNFGLNLYRLERLDEAQTHLARAYELRPGDPFAALSYALCLKDMGEIERALTVYRAALKIHPDHAELRWNLAQAELQSGDLAAGWDDCEIRWHLPSMARDLRFGGRPAWNGDLAALQGKRVLVWGEQGIGDEIAFASALSDFSCHAGHVTVECASKLVPLFARSFPGIDVRGTDRTRDADRLDFDVHLPMGDLFRHLRRRIEDFSGRPYLQADPSAVLNWKTRLEQSGPGLKIGIGWRSSLVTRQRQKHFFTDLAAWEPIFRIPGLTFVNLQPGEVQDELVLARQRFGCRIETFDDVDLFNDLDQVASLMLSLNVIVTNGSANAFLAAALGVPVWTFYLADSYWDLLGTKAIAWLPSLSPVERLWNEGWDNAVRRVADALSESVGQGRLVPPLFESPLRR